MLLASSNKSFPKTLQAAPASSRKAPAKLGGQGRERKRGANHRAEQKSQPGQVGTGGLSSTWWDSCLLPLGQSSIRLPDCTGGETHPALTPRGAEA